jgi:hypothetical protein
MALSPMALPLMKGVRDVGPSVKVIAVSREGFCQNYPTPKPDKFLRAEVNDPRAQRCGRALVIHSKFNKKVRTIRSRRQFSMASTANQRRKK